MCLFLNNVHNKLQSKFRLEVTHACHVNKFHATKTKDLVGSYQTLLPIKRKNSVSKLH